MNRKQTTFRHRLRTATVAALWAALLAIVLQGCSSARANERTAGTTVIGLDVSGSALSRKSNLMRLARMEILSTKSGTLEIHRFDRRVQELYSGDPIQDPEQLTRSLRTWFSEAAGGLGTSLPAFLQRVEERRSGLQRPLRIVVLSDCGMELTTPQEIRSARELTKRWADQGDVTESVVWGLAEGQREAIRDTVDPSLLRIQSAL